MEKRKGTLWILGILCGMICLFSLAIVSGCSQSVTEAEQEDIRERMPESEPIQASFTDPRLPGMKGVVESGHLKLFIDEQTAEIAVIDTRNGEIWRSNPEHRDEDAIASGTNKDLLSAQTRIQFYNAYGQISSINSQTDSVAYNQFAVEPIEGGVRVTYLFGKDEKGLDDLPQMLSPERYEELVAKMDDTGKRAMRVGYVQDEETGAYVRLDSALNGLQLQRVLDAFEAIGYTVDDLMRDSEEHQITIEKPVPRIFSLAIEYTLDGDSLVVRIPSDSIHHPEEFPIYNISLLNFFGAGGLEDEGSLFVPDGSGALIHFNNGKSMYPSFRKDVYGDDLTVQYGGGPARDQDIRLPVFGILRHHSAFLGIIEQGASVAVIHADVSGRLNSYNYVYPSFYYRNKDDVTLNAGGQQRSLPRFQVEPMQTDYVVRYVFFQEDEATYPAMAHYYRQYLLERKQLPERVAESDGNMPFYLELVGSIEKRKHRLGVPYRAQEPLTSFEQAQIILNELRENGIEDIRLKLTGWFNGGVNHSLPDKIKVNRSLGGRSGLNDLKTFADQADIALYPDMSILQVANTKRFSKSREAARRLTETPAVIYPYNLAINREDKSREPSYLLAPRRVHDVVEGMLDDFKKLGINQISLRDLADLLNSDYRKRNEMDRTQSEQISIQAMQMIRDAGIAMMADGGNAYAFPYLTDITRAPLSYSGFKIEDESIPFYQIVIRGHIDYTGEPYNLSTYIHPRQYILKSLEYGSGVYFTWIYEPNYKLKDTEFNHLYAVHYEHWMDLATEMYHELNGVLKQVQGQPIIDHVKLAEGVYKTTYGNGLYVIVNYNPNPVNIDGQTIEAEGFVTGGERS